MRPAGVGTSLSHSIESPDSWQGKSEFRPALTTFIEITSRNYKYLRPGIETAFYGARCMQEINPFGNRIRFNEDLHPQETS